MYGALAGRWREFFCPAYRSGPFGRFGVRAVTRCRGARRKTAQDDSARSSLIVPVRPAAPLGKIQPAMVTRSGVVPGARRSRSVRGHGPALRRGGGDAQDPAVPPALAPATGTCTLTGLSPLRIFCRCGSCRAVRRGLGSLQKSPCELANGPVTAVAGPRGCAARGGCGKTSRRCCRAGRVPGTWAMDGARQGGGRQRLGRKP